MTVKKLTEFLIGILVFAWFFIISILSSLFVALDVNAGMGRLLGIFVFSPMLILFLFGLYLFTKKTFK